MAFSFDFDSKISETVWFEEPRNHLEFGGTSGEDEDEIPVEGQKPQPSYLFRI